MNIPVSDDISFLSELDMTNDIYTNHPLELSRKV